jgi:hypothetical protein
MPPKKTKRKPRVETVPGPFAIAMANLSKAGQAYRWHVATEHAVADAHLRGRQKEAKDAYEGAGYSFDITEVMDMPKLEPATPPKIKHDPYSTPERKANWNSY